MKIFQSFFIWAVVFVLSKSDTHIYKTGWLDRVVQYFKDRFIADVHDKLPPIKFEATLVKAPRGYVDSKQWDYESVLRLLKLIHSNKKTRTLAIALRRSLSSVMGNGRRNYYQQKSFPKLNPQIDVFYSDSEYDSVEPIDFEDPSNTISGGIEDDAVVQISNPVEARLPSAHISVRMLREILEARAMAGRIMPSTKRSTISWMKSSKTTPKEDAKTNATNSTANSTDSNNSTNETPGNKTDADKPADGNNTANTGDNNGSTTASNASGDNNGSTTASDASGDNNTAAAPAAAPAAANTTK